MESSGALVCVSDLIVESEASVHECFLETEIIMRSTAVIS